MATFIVANEAGGTSGYSTFPSFGVDGFIGTIQIGTVRKVCAVAVCAFGVYSRMTE